ncbi:hypothetical protein F3Y22_tig00111372pilonHSYRG00047 [Hibiscus syriacus]|uniref:Protein kinase domain-containing protein n=1 Tax=Hibiscus syriacus TaxID=106335 RepID=A0A6A2YN04_HIBSY|nr:hypothetical protein F3Y22_tig00111372pilonHSYRG00047 [Hibiscus syriacus]
MEWVRGETIGYGTFGTVNLVLPKTGFPKFPLMAVKCCENGNSTSLKNEKQVLDQLGSLADHVKRNGGRLMESDVKRFVKSILRGLNFVHSKGFVHCDVKLQNVLLFGNGDVKLADFGLAKRNGEKQRRFEIRGTPSNMSPESINGNVYDFPVDIWAVGCDPNKRWTAEMLLDHPFMAADDDETTDPFPSTPSQCCLKFSESPRCPFDFPDRVSSVNRFPRKFKQCFVGFGSDSRIGFGRALIGLRQLDRLEVEGDGILP